MPEYERSLQDIKAEVLARIDIVEVISGYTRLTRAGKNWKGLCPFHTDKKPSFSVTPEFGHYRCWSCGEKGDVIAFVSKKENLDFIETLEWLARRAGIPFERSGVSQERASEREQMLELNRLAVRYFQDRLVKSQDAQSYLAGRGLLKSTQEQWDIGFAPAEWEGLTYFFQRQRVDMTLAAKLGLVKVREQEGGYYDAFRDRIIFPIHDVGGRVIAFGGRALSKEEQAKYLNSPQSDLFDKSRTLYGLCFAKKKLSGDTPPVFVEGYVDVVTAHQAGFTQCVATLGTSMTEEHARMLVRYNPKVLISYDSDTAGIKATLRGAEVWESLGVEGAEVRVARLPDGDDPDSLLRRGETAAFQKALDNAVPRVEFQVELALKRHDIRAETGKDNALAEIIPILASIGALSQRTRYAEKLVYLHPANGYNVGLAIEQILADAQTYLRQSRPPHVGRNSGYPLTEEQNRASLAEEPPPPTFRPPNAETWGQASAPQAFPYTHNTLRKGEGRPQDYRGRNTDGGYNKSGYGNGGRFQAENGNYRGGNGGGYGRNGRRYREGPIGDPSPPPLTAPTSTHADKAEQQLLRACFSPEWRLQVMTRLDRELLVSEEGKALLGWLKRTPATPEGGIDAGALMRRIEAAAEELNTCVQEDLPPGYDPNQDPFADEIGMGSEEKTIDSPEVANQKQKSLKLSAFLYDLMQESPFLVSNDRLSEAVVNSCIRDLRRHQEEQRLREQKAFLLRLEQLPPEERRQAEEQYMMKVREKRGSPPSQANG